MGNDPLIKLAFFFFLGGGGGYRWDFGPLDSHDESCKVVE